MLAYKIEMDILLLGEEDEYRGNRDNYRITDHKQPTLYKCEPLKTLRNPIAAKARLIKRSLVVSNKARNRS